MTRNTHKITTGCSLLLGVGLWAGFAVRFNTEEKLSYEPNPACVKGSPYGKVLALALQGPIDFYWHKGQSHEHLETLNAGDKHDENCTSCDHHSHHDHSAKAKQKPEHAEGCGCGAHGEDNPVVHSTPEKPWHTLAKTQIKKMSAAAHRKTDGKPLSDAHLRYLQSVTEDKLRLAYELDPTNYTNYGNYHLFIATTSYGKSDGNDDKAVALARKTLEACKKDEVDPSSWITAASAAYNIIFHIGRYHDQFTIAEAKASLAEFDECMRVYEGLLADAVDNGRIPSVQRLNELNTRAKYLTKLRHAQGVYMKRMMTTHMADNTTPPSAH